MNFLSPIIFHNDRVKKYHIVQFDNRGNYRAIIYYVTRLKGYFILRCNATNFQMHIYAAIGQVC